MNATKKIRVCLIGLNAPPPGTASGTNWAAGGHLPYLSSSDNYELVALQNSSAARAAEAIKAYGLDADTKAYGTPEGMFSSSSLGHLLTRTEVASDPEIDLVVSCIRVDRHASSLIPSIEGGKDVFTEWPMEADLTKAKALADAVKQQHGKVRHVVGVQGRYNPLASKLRDMIAAGAIGNVESSTFVAHAYGGASLPSPVDYFADKKVGGNPFTIVFAHSMEFVQQGSFQQNDILS
jgi:predicted dehydrogenase